MALTFDLIQSYMQK